MPSLIGNLNAPKCIEAWGGRWRKKEVEEPKVPAVHVNLVDYHWDPTQLITDHHWAFSFMIAWVWPWWGRLQIDTVDSAHPVKQPPRRMPFAVRQEAAQQLRNIQEGGCHVIFGPALWWWFWKDSIHTASVIKPDLFPLPRIQLSSARLGTFDPRLSQ
jgi:hypothetical protein